MEKCYEKPALSVTHFSADDIITTSSTPTTVTEEVTVSHVTDLEY